jgi:Glycine zipper
MKTLLLSLTCVAGLVASAGAQVFQPQTARNILVGSIAGAIIGENNDKPLEGALIGAAAGAVWSAVTVPSNDRSYAPPVPQAPVYRETTYYPEPVCRPEPARVVVVAPRCDPPRRTVVVHRPPVVVVDPCPPTRVVVRSHANHHHRRTVVVRHPAHQPSRGGVVYVGPGYDGCR